MNVTLPKVDDSLWTETLMSMDFPAFDDTEIFGSNLVDGNSWEMLQSPWRTYEYGWMELYICSL
ncbi:hypothetical protein CK203_008025 [Vitis vinifera]|uniref:Uncharacterized protein n=1 Tax=Vitis vinifera TaxID=29760 RepID=A0A438K1Q0_VITVI|nr:hypothetical protein CK203_008025 [Vitis vinifera]